MRLPFLSRTLIQGVLPGALVLVLAFPPDIFSQAPLQASDQDHIVSPQALQQQLETSSSTRQQEIATLSRFLSSPTAERAMQDAHINPVQVQTAIPTLTDQELATLSTRAADAQQKFSAGMMNNDMLLIVILLVAVIIIVVAVH